MKIEKVQRLKEHWLIFFTDCTAQVVRHAVVRNTDDALSADERLIGALCERLAPQHTTDGPK